MGRRILVVDDELDVRAVLEDILCDAGFEVEAAENGEQALNKLSVRSFDLMVLDIMMPVKNGYQVLEEMTDQQKADMPVILLTAMAAEQDVIDGYKKGACYYIVKPFDNATLVNAIHYMLGDITDDGMGELETTPT